MDPVSHFLVRIEEKERPLLESAANEDAGLFAALMGGGQHVLEAATVRLLNAV